MFFVYFWVFKTKNNIMKKITLIVLAVLVVSSIQAQLHFGPQIGFSSSKLTSNIDSIKTDFKSNIMFGAFVRIGKKIYVQPEVNWLTQGSVFKYPEVNLGGSNLSPFQQDIKLNSINIPVSLGWRMVNLEVVNIRIFIGLNTNIVVNKHINNSQDVSDVDDDLFKPIKDSDIKNLTWNYHAGVGVDVLMFALDVKYVGAFGEPIVGNIKYNSGSHTISSSSNMFLITLGWKIF
jgi:hypothetical protein